MASKRSRRANREGSVFQLSDGSWRGYITIGFDRDGKQQKKWVRGKSQKIAVERLNKIRHLASGDLVEAPERVTVSEWLRRVYEIKRTRVKPKTLQSYGHYQRKILPALGHIQLQKLTGLQVEEFYGTIMHLSPSVRQHIHDYLKSSFKLAQRHGLVTRNPLDPVERPKGGPLTKPKVWNAEQIGSFLSTTENHRLHPAFYFLLTAGFRIGELLGLKWSDLDEDKLHVRRTLTVEDWKPTFGEPKTERSKRIVYLSSADLQVLKAHHLAQAEERSVAKRWEDNDLIFPSSTGTPIHYKNFRRTYKRLIDQAGVPEIRIHDLRHTYVTMARDAGLDAEVIANRVGHDVRMTMALYSNVTEQRKRKAALSLGELLERGAQ